MERKSKKKATKVNLKKPVNVEIFGTEDDPCFGKHYSDKAEECGMCGDSELCIIIMSQKQHGKRAEIEAKASYKDLEENFINNVYLEKYLIKYLKKKGSIKLTKAYSITNKRFNPLGQVTKKEIKSSVLKCLESSVKIKIITKDKVKHIKL